jgi:hypothetical protein
MGAGFLGGPPGTEPRGGTPGAERPGGLVFGGRLGVLGVCGGEATLSPLTMIAFLTVPVGVVAAGAVGVVIGVGAGGPGFGLGFGAVVTAET